MKTKSPTKRWVKELSRHFPKIYRWWKQMKRCSTFLITREMKVKTTMSYHLTAVRMVTIKKSTNNKCWRGCGEMETLLHCWWRHKLIQPIWGTVVGRGCLLWPVYSLRKTLLAFALLHFVLQSQTHLLLQISWIPTFAFQSAMMKRTFFFLLILKGFVGHHRTIWLQVFRVSGWGIDLDYCDIEWFVLESNSDHSIIFEVALKNFISDSFVDYEGN